MGLLFLSFTITLAGCGSDKSALAFSNSTTNGQSEIKVAQDNDPAFASIQKDLIGVSCIKCHNANQTKHSNLTSKAVVLENADDMLYRMTDAWDIGVDNMPPKGNPVNPVVIKEFKSWMSDNKFANLQKSLFQASCLKCHSATQTKHANLTSKAVVIEKYDDIIYKMTTAFDIDDEPMPPVGKGNKVSPELIKELQKWKESL